MHLDGRPSGSGSPQTLQLPDYARGGVAFQRPLSQQSQLRAFLQSPSGHLNSVNLIAIIADVKIDLHIIVVIIAVIVVGDVEPLSELESGC